MLDPGPCPGPCLCGDEDDDDDDDDDVGPLSDADNDAVLLILSSALFEVGKKNGDGGGFLTPYSNALPVTCATRVVPPRRCNTRGDTEVCASEEGMGLLCRVAPVLPKK